MDRYLATLDHEEIIIRRGRRSGLFTMVAIHSTARGPGLGGCRMWSYGDARAALRDVMRLAEGMTYKAACANLPLGGGKGVIMAPPGEPLQGEARRAALLDFGETVDAAGGRYLTAEDVGISDEDVAIMAETTSHVTGLSRERGGSGDPSPWTALGVEMAVRVSCERVFGSDDLNGLSACVVGLGHVGGDLARRLAAGGATLTLSDVDPAKRSLADELGATWMEPELAMFADVDVLAPCALGGVLDHETVPRLNARVVAGAANNQLADPSVAPMLVEHGVLWAPDFVANAGGIINISVELEPGGYSEERAEERVRTVADTMRRIYDDVEATGRTPLDAAMELARQRLAEAAEATTA